MGQSITKSKKIKLGWIDFYNTIPFDYELIGIKPDIQIERIKSYPSKINKLLYNTEIDVGFISSAEYIENFDRYILFPNLSISALNKVKSVAIFSNTPIDEINTIYLTTQSKTSRYLTKIIFTEFFNKSIQYKDLTNLGSVNNKSVLLIGDDAIRYTTKFNFIYDLSEIWYKNTKLPFVFALWTVRKELIYTRYKDLMNLYNTFKISKDKFFKNPEFYLSRRKDINIDKKFLENYLKNLDYSLTKKHLESLKLFSKLLLKNGFIKKFPEFNFIQINGKI